MTEFWTRPFTWTHSDGTNTMVWPIAGGSEDAASDDGDATEGDTSGETSGGTDDGETGDEKMLPQAQVNEIVAREVAKAQRGKLDPKELGFESAKDMKDFLDAARKKAEDDKDESQKALEAAIKEAEESARKEVLSVANERLVKAEFIIEASKHNVQFAEDAYALARTLDLWEDVAIDDGGNVSGFDKKFFEDLKKSKPFLFAESKPPDAGAGAHGEGPGDSSLGKLAAEYPALRDAVAARQRQQT